MAQKTMEKNSFLKFFELLKDHFFSIVLLGSIFSLATVLAALACFGLAWVLVTFIGDYAIFNFFTFLPCVLLVPCMSAIIKIFRHFVTETPTMLWSDLRQAFKQNFLQSLLLGVVEYVAIVLVTIAYNYYSLAAAINGENILAQLGLGICLVFALMILLTFSYSLMMIVTLDLKFRKILKNSLIFCYLCLPRNVLLVISLGVWVAICFALVYVSAISGMAIVGGIVLMFLLLFALSIAMYIIAFFTFPPVKKYILDPYYESHPEETSKQIEEDDNGDEVEQTVGEKPLPEYVYHNGRMVHRSIFEREKLLDEEE